MSESRKSIEGSTKQLNVRIPIGLHEQLADFCATNDLSHGAVVRVALHQFLDRSIDAQTGVGPAQTNLVRAIEHLDGAVKGIAGLAALIKGK